MLVFHKRVLGRKATEAFKNEPFVALFFMSDYTDSLLINIINMSHEILLQRQRKVKNKLPITSSFTTDYSDFFMSNYSDSVLIIIIINVIVKKNHKQALAKNLTERGDKWARLSLIHISEPTRPP